MFRPRLALAGAALALTAACGGSGGGGSGGAPGDTSTTAGVAATPGTQHQFHPQLVEALRVRFDELVPERFTLEAGSVRVVDVTRGEVQFTSQKELGEFARQQGLLGFGAADLTASGGFEYWGIVSHVFTTRDGARATFERFPNPEQVTIDDAVKTNTVEGPFREGALGNASVETYSYTDGTSSLVLRGSLVDANVVHYVSAVVDVPPGQAVDGMGDLRRVLLGLEGFYPAVFTEFLRLGGTDAPTTTTTLDPTFVPGEEIPGDG